MATLFITQTGFRFPYQRWTDVTSIQNLQFLEAQLDEYLHSHEDDGTTLWVTSEGFRVPDKKVLDNLEENMKFIEVQLEKYLHEHETTGAGELLPDPDCDLQASTVKSFSDSLGSDDYYVYDPNLIFAPTFSFTSSTANPHATTRHLRTTDTGGTSTWNVIARDPNVSTTWLGQPLFELSPGGSIVGSCWVRRNPSLDPVEVFNIDLIILDSNLNAVNSAFEGDGVITGSYQQFTTEALEVPSNAAYVLFRVNLDNIFADEHNMEVDLDSFSLRQTQELVTTHQGFRFPYGWENEGHIKHNMKYLETQVSQFLHKHEVGT